jgi:tagatose-1,6-bisphosphate aldolase non-catalytic subunit AgaZ/GatZ
VDAAIEQAYLHGRRTMLIASRRQVDAEAFGYGYVERWTPETFAAYVRARDPDRLVVLCRDHGGPWQNPREADAEEGQALAGALRSFRADIEAGFDLLHIDTSAERAAAATYDDAIRRLVSLYSECHELASQQHRDVSFEIGFETQGSEVANPCQFGAQVRAVIGHLRSRDLPAPTFVVAQTGTKVEETENTGDIVREPSKAIAIVRDLARVCARLPVQLKAHNADYLSTVQLRELVAAGVAAANVAPELGVLETRALLAMLEHAGLRALRDEFLAVAFDSGAWKKWLKPQSRATDVEKATIAGHYVFAAPQVAEIKERLAIAEGREASFVDCRLRAAIGARISLLLGCTCANPPRRRMGHLAGGCVS